MYKLPQEKTQYNRVTVVQSVQVQWSWKPNYDFSFREETNSSPRRRRGQVEALSPTKGTGIPSTSLTNWGTLRRHKEPRRPRREELVGLRVDTQSSQTAVRVGPVVVEIPTTHRHKHNDIKYSVDGGMKRRSRKLERKRATVVTISTTTEIPAHFDCREKVDRSRFRVGVRTRTHSFPGNEKRKNLHLYVDLQNKRCDRTFFVIQSVWSPGELIYRRSIGRMSFEFEKGKQYSRKRGC